MEISGTRCYAILRKETSDFFYLVASKTANRQIKSPEMFGGNQISKNASLKKQNQKKNIDFRLLVKSFGELLGFLTEACYYSAKLFTR